MYYTQCDWCGDGIDTKATYVKVHIEVVTTSTDYRGQRETRTEPTRFFHVHSLRSPDEWDRLGIEVKDEGIGDCCYTRALKAIEGDPEWDAPDAGFEWRLMPVDGAPDPDHNPVLDEPLWHTYESGREWMSPELVKRGLSYGKNTRAMRNAGLRTVGDLLRAIEDGSLLKLKGIGPKTFAEIEQSLRALLDASAAKAVCGAGVA